MKPGKRIHQSRKEKPDVNDVVEGGKYVEKKNEKLCVGKLVGERLGSQGRSCRTERMKT